MAKGSGTTSDERGRRILLGVVALAIIIGTTYYAFTQPPHPVPFDPIHFDPIDPDKVEGWLSPIEWNTFRRVGGSRYRNATVFGTPDAAGLWMVASDFVLFSEDGGENWTRRNVPGGQLSP